MDRRERDLRQFLREERRRIRRSGTPDALFGLHLRPLHRPALRGLGIGMAAFWLGLVALLLVTSGASSLLALLRALPPG